MKRKKSSESESCQPDDLPIAKKGKAFSGFLFRQKLTGEDPISALQSFLKIFREHELEHDIVLEFFEAGGNGEEILLLLGDGSRSVEEVSVIFNVLECIFMRIMTDLPSYLPDAEETAKCLLQSHLTSFYRLLSGNSSFVAKKAVLKLLTVMSTLSTKVAKYILTYLKISFTALIKLTKHEKQNSTRTHFVHFVLSFIVEGSPSVIKLLLDKTGLLKSIFPGLLYDTVDTVELILATITKHILENPLVSKTTKLHIFNSINLRIFFELFDWRGPQKQVKKKSARNLSETMIIEVDPVSKSHVEEAVYRFLRVLCASRKFGVVFFDPSFGTSGKHHNQLVYKVLETLEKPWEKNLVSKLLLEIFTCCPDLIHGITSRMVPFLEPRLSPKWFKAIDFIEKVIDGLEPSIYLSKSGSLNLAQLMLVFEHLVTPKSILQVIFGSPLNENNSEVDGLALKNTHLLVRHSAVRLLNSISNAALRFMDYKGLEDYFGSLAAANQFRQNLLDHLFMVLPSVACVLQVWKQAVHDINNEEIKNEEFDSMLSSCDLQYPSAVDHLKAVLSLLLAYVRFWPPLEITAEGDSIEDGWGLLNSLTFLKEAQQVDGLETMALEFLSATGSFTLSADQGLANRDILKRLLQLYGKENEKMSSLSWRQLLISVLLNTGLFDGNETEACLWIHCYRYCCHEYHLNEEKCDTLAEFIVSSLCNLISSSEHYLCLISNAFEVVHNLEKSQMGNITRRLLIDMMEKDFDAEEDTLVIAEQTGCIQDSAATISPLLPAALVEAKNYEVGTEDHDTINHYLLYVVLHVFHGQDSPKPLLYILESNSSSYSPPKSLKRYLKSWSSSKPRCVDDLISGDNPWCHCSSMLLAKTKSYNGTSKNNFPTINGISDGLHALFLFRLVIFHLAHLALQDNLNDDTLAIGKDMLLQLIQHSCLSEKEENALYQKAGGKDINIYRLTLQSAFSNSILLKYFEPLGGNNDSQRYVTHLVDHILNLANSVLDDKDYINNVTLPFKNKLMQNICTSLDHLSKHEGAQNNWDETMMESFLSRFTLSSEDIIHLLDVFVTIPSESLIDPNNWKLSGPGLLLTKLLRELCTLKKMGCPAIVKSESFKSVVDHLHSLEEKFELCALDEAGNRLSLLEDSVLQFLQMFPHLIEVTNLSLLEVLISSKFNRKSANMLGQFLIIENEKFRSFFLELCTTRWNEVASNPDRLLMFFTCILESSQSAIPDVILMKLFLEYKGAFKEMFNRCLGVPSWLENNTQLFKLIVQRAVDEEVCYKLWNLVKRKSSAFVDVEHSFLEITHSLIEKAETCSSIHCEESLRVSFLKLVLNGFIKVLKTASKYQSDDSDDKVKADLTFYTEFIGAVLDGIDKKERKSNKVKKVLCNDWSELRKMKMWREFTQLTLKVGISQKNISLLKCFGKLCIKVLIKDDSEAVLLYKMCIMHSKFLDVMLEDEIGKGEILEILLILLEKNPANSSNSLIPVLLSSYGATLGKCDTVILKLLKMLDSDGLNFNQFSPYLWGEMAASFYSLKSKVNSAAFSAFSILRQPKADQVLDLIDTSIVERTIKDFPIHRDLQAQEPLDINSADSNVYDPCFYLPLFSHILAPENPVKVYKFSQSGALALSVAALGSHDGQVRAAAMHVLARFYSHLETGRLNKEKKLWMNFINVLRNGFGLLAKSKNADVSNLQLPPVVALFLAKASLIMSDPQHIMFFPLHNFFLAKPALDLEAVPEFFRLFNSSEEKSLSYRHWILEVIRDGLRDSLDFHACLNSGIFKHLMSCFYSNLCDEKSKVLILEIFASAVRSPSTAYYLVRGHGLMSWLHDVVLHLPVFSNKDNPYFVRSLIRLFSFLLLAFSKEDKNGLLSARDGQHSPFLIFVYNNALLLHLYLLSKILYVELNLKDFSDYMKSLWSVTQLCCKSHQKNVKLINRQDVNNIIQLGKNVLKNVDVCQDALEYGCYIFPPSKELFSDFDAPAYETLQCLFRFVVNWCQTEIQCK